MAGKLQAIVQMRKLAESGLDAMGEQAESRGERLREVRDLYGFFEEGYADIVRRWDEKKGAAR